ARQDVQIQDLLLSVMNLREQAGRNTDTVESLRIRLDVAETLNKEFVSLFAMMREALKTGNEVMDKMVPYTSKEVNRMSADEYRHKVLRPLEIGRVTATGQALTVRAH
ncbi:MAG: hypothetical protein ACREQ5_24265, partial [Candidatus Dormibacteria bacterium]